VVVKDADLWFAKTLADFEINDMAALPPEAVPRKMSGRKRAAYWTQEKSA